MLSLCFFNIKININILKWKRRNHCKSDYLIFKKCFSFINLYDSSVILVCFLYIPMYNLYYVWDLCSYNWIHYDGTNSPLKE